MKPITHQGDIMENETAEDYTTKDFGKDVAKIVGISVAELIAANALLLGIGFAAYKVMELRERRAAKKNQTEK
jgi:hypothetical protein